MTRQFYPALDAATEAALRASIQRFGVLVPPTVDQHGEIIDGHHRSRIAADLGVPFAPVVREVSSEEEAREIARTLNEDRRMLSREQRLPVVAVLKELGHSNVAIGKALGVTEGTVRLDLKSDEVRSVTNLPDRVEGLDGKSYPAKRRRPQHNLETQRGQIIAAAGVRKINSMMAAIDGYRSGLADYNTELAFATASREELARWHKSATEFITTLNTIRQACREAQG